MATGTFDAWQKASASAQTKPGDHFGGFPEWAGVDLLNVFSDEGFAGTI
jgi:hypothetical protein